MGVSVSSKPLLLCLNPRSVCFLMFTCIDILAGRLVASWCIADGDGAERVYLAQCIFASLRCEFGGMMV